MWRKQNIFSWLWYQFYVSDEGICHHEFSLYIREEKGGETLMLKKLNQVFANNYIDQELNKYKLRG